MAKGKREKKFLSKNNMLLGKNVCCAVKPFLCISFFSHTERVFFAALKSSRDFVICSYCLVLGEDTTLCIVMCLCTVRGSVRCTMFSILGNEIAQSGK